MLKIQKLDKVMEVLRASGQFSSHELAAILGTLYFPFDTQRTNELKTFLGEFFYEEIWSKKVKST